MAVGFVGSPNIHAPHLCRPVFRPHTPAPPDRRRGGTSRRGAGRRGREGCPPRLRGGRHVCPHPDTPAARAPPFPPPRFAPAFALAPFALAMAEAWERTKHPSSTALIHERTFLPDPLAPATSLHTMKSKSAPSLCPDGLLQGYTQSRNHDSGLSGRVSDTSHSPKVQRSLEVIGAPQTPFWRPNLKIESKCFLILCEVPITLANRGIQPCFDASYQLDSLLPCLRHRAAGGPRILKPFQTPTRPHRSAASAGREAGRGSYLREART
jgi:hypothetical protein